MIFWLNTHHETSLGLHVIGSDITNSQTELTWKMSAHTGTGGFLWSLSEQDERCDLDSLFVGWVRPGYQPPRPPPTCYWWQPSDHPDLTRPARTMSVGMSMETDFLVPSVWDWVSRDFLLKFKITFGPCEENIMMNISLHYEGIKCQEFWR